MKQVLSGLYGLFSCSGVPRGVVWGVQTLPEILKISVESSDLMSKKNRRLDFLLSSLCSHTVVIY